MVDIGGQWVTGAENNAAYDLAWPLGLIEEPSEQRIQSLCSSSGSPLPEKVGNNLLNFFFNLTDEEVDEEYQNGSIGSWYTHKYVRSINVNHKINGMNCADLSNQSLSQIE